MKRSVSPGRTALGVLLACLALSIMSAPPVFAADAAQFPAISSSYLKAGAFIGPDHVRRITLGLNKDQVRLELGNPHFGEGIFGVREWNYVFNFYTGKANHDYVTCQFNVQFDKDYRVASTSWNSPECESYVTELVAVPVGARATAVITLAPATAAGEESPSPGRRRVVLATNGMFAFGKSGLIDLVSPGREKLDALLAQVRQDAMALSSVVVTGHADRIGPNAANVALSLARAETVRAYLVKGGVNSQLIRAHGAGESRPVVDCSGDSLTPTLVACLQPNRRVEIESVGEK